MPNIEVHEDFHGLSSTNQEEPFHCLLRHTYSTIHTYVYMHMPLEN